MENIADELRKAAQEVSEAARGVYAARQRALDIDSRHGATTGTSNVIINAGGVGVWIATTCCLLCMAVTGLGAVYVMRDSVRHDMQLSEARDDIKAIRAYINAGLVKQKEEKK